MPFRRDQRRVEAFAQTHRVLSQELVPLFSEVVSTSSGRANRLSCPLPPAPSVDIQTTTIYTKLMPSELQKVVGVPDED